MEVSRNARFPPAPQTMLLASCSAPVLPLLKSNFSSLFRFLLYFFYSLYTFFLVPSPAPTSGAAHFNALPPALPELSAFQWDLQVWWWGWDRKLIKKLETGAGYKRAEGMWRESKRQWVKVLSLRAQQGGSAVGWGGLRFVLGELVSMWKTRPTSGSRNPFFRSVRCEVAQWLEAFHWEE